MAGTITDCANIFNHSPERQRCLEKVISLDQLESQRTKIRDLCRTRWVERHEAYETFVQLLSVVKTFEVILGEQQHHVLDGHDENSGGHKADQRKAIKKGLSNEIVTAYNMETEKELKELRDKNDFVFQRWYAYAAEISSELGTEPSAPRTAQRQVWGKCTP